MRSWADPRLAAAVLTVGLVTACGGGNDYCGVVKDNQQRLAKVVEEGRAGDGAAGLKALPIYERLADAAPDDVRSQWRIVISRLTALQDALDDAGVDPSTYDPEKPPAGLSAEEQQKIADASLALQAPESLRAIGEVQQHARDVCQMQLTG